MTSCPRLVYFKWREREIGLGVESFRELAGPASCGRRQPSGHRLQCLITWQTLRYTKCSPKVIGAPISFLNTMALDRVLVMAIDGCCRADGEWQAHSRHYLLAIGDSRCRPHQDGAEAVICRSSSVQTIRSNQSRF